jgi:hypothetical protein
MESLRPRFVRAAALGAAAAWWALTPVHANGTHNPTSKFYVADVDGDSDVDTGNKVDDLTKQSVYSAEGTVIETHDNGTNAIVFSNGTGLFFDEDTRMEVKEFQQEPFVPNRTDMNMEPSVSKTDTFIPHGTVGLCTSKMAAGSTMTYSTPLGSVNITGGKLVVSANSNSTVISDLEGVATVNVGDTDTGGDVIKDGQQAVITPGENGGPPTIKIQNIPAGELSALNAKVTMACNAKKTVYFEARGSNNDAIVPLGTPDSTTGGVTAFDGDDGAAPGNNPGNGQGNQQQIVAVPVAPATTPVQFTQSPASLPGNNPAGQP